MIQQRFTNRDPAGQVGGAIKGFRVQRIFFLVNDGLINGCRVGITAGWLNKVAFASDIEKAFNAGFVYRQPDLRSIITRYSSLIGIDRGPFDLACAERSRIFGLVIRGKHVVL